MATNQAPPVNIQQIIDRADWWRTLETDYEATKTRLVTAYERALPSIRDAIALLEQRLGDLQDARPGETITTGQVTGLEEYRNLLRRMEIEMRDFAGVVRNEAGTLQDRGIVVGANAAEDMTSATAGNLNTVIQTGWNRPDPAALARLIDTVDGAPFREKASAFGQNAAQQIADMVLTAVAQGKNPRAIAGLLRNGLLIPYGWAENMVRTAQLWAYRGASHATYAANSRVLEGWVWYAALDTRTCLSCISQHGRKYPLTASLNDHHQGRCTPVPIVRGSTWPDLIITGPNWFESQPASYQRAQMGGALWRAWQDGAIRWNEMSQPYQDDVYGEMLREVSVSGALGKEAAQQYYWFNQ